MKSYYICFNPSLSIYIGTVRPLPIKNAALKHSSPQAAKKCLEVIANMFSMPLDDWKVLEVKPKL